MTHITDDISIRSLVTTLSVCDLDYRELWAWQCFELWNTWTK